VREWKERTEGGRAEEAKKAGKRWEREEKKRKKDEVRRAKEE
jgi:hypothetical protein